MQVVKEKKNVIVWSRTYDLKKKKKKKRSLSLVVLRDYRQTHLDGFW